jgi:hypothetical protein
MNSRCGREAGWRIYDCGTKARTASMNKRTARCMCAGRRDTRGRGGHSAISSTGTSCAKFTAPGGMLNGDLVFTVSSFDPSNTLVLDPWSTYYGGSRVDYILALACDSSDAVYATGTTYSFDFPVYRAWQARSGRDPNSTTSGDIIVLRFDRHGGLSWATLYGGRLGQGASGIASDPYGNVVLVGGTLQPSISRSTTPFSSST